MSGTGKASLAELAVQASTIRDQIDTVEGAPNDRIAELYRLTPDERALISAQ
jgi:hypothetical protein